MQRNVVISSKHDGIRIFAVNGVSENINARENEIKKQSAMLLVDKIGIS